MEDQDYGADFVCMKGKPVSIRDTAMYKPVSIRDTAIRKGYDIRHHVC